MVISYDPRLDRPVEEPALDVQGFERPRALMDLIPEDLSPLLELVGRSVVTSRQVSRAQLVQLCRLAARYETQPQHNSRPLTGKILISAFYEPSTRTRLSFESAWHRLGGDIMSITDPATTGIAKGESIYDVGEMLNNYGDLVVLRDASERAIYEMREALRIPIVNGGNGIDEHPTQAMADIYAILKWRPELALDEALPADKRIRMIVVGVPGRMRTVRSLLFFLSRFAQGFAEVVVVTDDNEPFSEGQRENLESRGLQLRVSDNLDEELPLADVVYINAKAWVGESYEEHGAAFQLNTESPLKSSAIILHPLARGDELARDLDDTSHNWYFAQARGAVYIRMALLAAILRTFN